LKLKTSSLLIAGALFGAAVMPAQADEAMMDLLKVLRDQGTITAQNYDLLKNAAAADKEATDAVKADVAKVNESMPKITTKGKIKIESADGKYSFQPIGRVMWDAVSTDGDDSGKEFHGTELRRARLGFQGKVEDFGYKFEADFAGGDASIKDAYVSYNTKLAGNKTSIKLGQSQIAFGFNTAASSKYMTFMDRPWYADKATSPARQSGVAAKVSGKAWSAATSVTQGSLKDGTTEENEAGTTFALRGTFMPMKSVQVGAGYMSVSSNAEGFKFSNHLTAHEDPLKIGTALSSNDYDGSDAFEMDAVGIFGPFHALAEYNAYAANSKGNTDDVDVNSYSVEAGYFLTGESMKLKHGLWGGITPKSSAGAWQLAARYENTAIDGDSIEQEADMATFGVNYYANKNVRFMLDYSQVLSNENNAGDLPEPSAVKFRAQAKW